MVRCCSKKNLNASRPPCLKKNQNVPRPSEHPPVRGEKMSKRLGGIKGCKYKTASWHLNGFPDGNNVGSTVYVGEKPTVILYIYINRHAWTPERHKEQIRDNVVHHPVDPGSSVGTS